MNRGVPPFLLPDADVVNARPWQLHQDTGTVPLPAFLADWDYSTDLRLTRDIQVDTVRALREAALPSRAPLLLVVEWTAAAAQTSDRASRTSVPDSAKVTVTADIRGACLGGALILTTRLVLGEDTPATDPFLAQHAGDVLYEDTARIELQGTAGRLPTYVVNFAEAGFDPDARWHVELPTSLSEPAMAAVRLYLNSADIEVVNAAKKAAAPTPVQQRILAWMESDLTSRLVEAALRPEWRETLHDYADDVDSIGASLAVLLRTLFPYESPPMLATMRDSDPGRFHSRLQGAQRRMRAHRDDDAVPPTV
ncbi:hypothetical protein DKM19_42965 [Streptosporangium sp. 'caverna']|nr:hypothetical protein [Streptosporangium sp. 'caverna']AWS47060.1 hypothetical protein DKM19_42965 [Streptosporangium sp. 'caverna']